MHSVEYAFIQNHASFLSALRVAVSNNAVFSSYVNLSITGVFSDIY